jgi:regulator of cell morphogenesis and NO signaling
MMITMPTTTVKDLVVEDFRTAGVFEKFGIDFCCNGNRSLDEACRAKGISTSEVEAELAKVKVQRDSGETHFENWDPSLLTAYITKVHHRYVKDITPALLMHVKKVAAVHGEHHPEMKRVQQLFEQVSTELASHMMREEQMLFPYINVLANAEETHNHAPSAPFGSVNNPIQMMMTEHEDAGNALAEIRLLTHAYVPPEDACTTYRVTLSQLADYELDLHKHVHLENNILFPKAIVMENELLAVAA